MTSDYPFSSRTTGLLIQAIIAGHSATSMGTLWMLGGVDHWEPVGPNKESQAQSMFRTLRTSGEAEDRKGALELARLMLVKGKPDSSDWWATPKADWWTGLRDAIEADGWEFDIKKDVLVPTVPGVSVAAESSWIEDDLLRRGWTAAAGHYKQAVESFAAGNWAAANGQLRTFLESTVRTAGGTIGKSGPGQVQAAADSLAAHGSISKNEADFIKKLWSMLHAGGSHPGLSDHDESRFRLLTLTGYARLLLSRLP